jgi:uncharacterized membrane protein YcjF (UPF0283 family)
MPPDTTPFDATYWADYGIAALILFFVASGVVYALREWWSTYKPHYVAKKQAETVKEEAQARLFQTLTETEPAKVVAQQQTAALLGKVTENQQDTHTLVKEIHNVVHKWKHNEP